MIDFDAVLRDPDRINPRLDSGDRLHPGDTGNRAMAEAIDVAVLLPGLGTRPNPIPETSQEH